MTRPRQRVMGTKTSFYKYGTYIKKHPAGHLQKPSAAKEKRAFRLQPGKWQFATGNGDESAWDGGVSLMVGLSLCSDVTLTRPR